MLKLRKLLIALSLIAGACSITNIAAAATEAEVAAAVVTLEAELAAATTDQAVADAKAKAADAGVPAATIQVAVAAAQGAPLGGAGPAVVSQQSNEEAPVAKKSVAVAPAAVGGSSPSSIPSGSTDIGDTGSTYN
jgi:membrane-bound lytic murein transglycosylase B